MPYGPKIVLSLFGFLMLIYGGIVIAILTQIDNPSVSLTNLLSFWELGIGGLISLIFGFSLCSEIVREPHATLSQGENYV